MEKSTSKSKQFNEPSLCKKCHTFYANPQYNSYCSSCFKEIKSENEPENKIIRSKPKSENIEIKVQTKVEEPAKKVDPSKCYHCCKKIGIRGFKCKCTYFFCKKHRLPESHSCDFDYAKDGKRKLQRLNPKLQSEKIEKI